MITVISGTNRRGNETAQFARFYFEHLRRISEEEIKLLALDAIPHDWFDIDMYSKDALSPALIRLQDEYILPADKFAFFVSEYNGSYPGVLKLFIDAVSVRHYRDNFSGKKAALIGIASGRAGNLLGMDHLAAVLNHLGTTVMPNRLPISQLSRLLDAEGRFNDPETQQLLMQHAADLVAF